MAERLARVAAPGSAGAVLLPPSGHPGRVLAQLEVAGRPAVSEGARVSPPLPTSGACPTRTRLRLLDGLLPQLTVGWIAAGFKRPGPAARKRSPLLRRERPGHLSRPVPVAAERGQVLLAMALGERGCQEAGPGTQAEDGLVLEGIQMMDLERVRAQVPVGATARMAGEMAVILVSREHPQLPVHRAVPLPELRATPVGVIAAAAASLATAPATVARVPGAHRWPSHGSVGVRVR